MNFGQIGPPFGIRVIESAACYETETVRFQVRFPKSKKRRVRKKWSKNTRNWSFKVNRIPTAVKIGNDLFAHPDIVAKLRRAFPA